MLILKNYEKNIGIVFDTLERYQYSQKKVLLSKRCYAELGSYIKEQNITLFSFDIALYWCETIVKEADKIEFRKAILRLDDVYKYNYVLASHLRFLGQISEPYLSIVNNYLISVSKSNTYLQRKKQVCKLFCIFLHANGIFSIEKITYTTLMQYHEYLQKTTLEYKDSIGIISDFLRYCAENQYCQIGYSLFMHYIVVNKIILLESFSNKSISIIKDRQKFSTSISSQEFYESILSFLNELAKYKYSEKTLRKTKNQLLLLYSFLDSQNLNYDKTIADTWVDECGIELFGITMTSNVRLTIKRYDDYIKKGVINVNQSLTSIVPAYTKLPFWCKQELEPFFDNKRKEGLSDGTIVAYRTSLTRFCNFLIKNGINSFSEITSEKIKHFNIQDSHETTAGKNACNMRIRKFLIYLELKKIISAGIHFALACKAANNKRIVEILSQEDRLIINEYCQKAYSPLELRDAAILKIGMSTALRASDIVNLKISNIDWKNKVIKIIQSKTKTEHIHILDIETGNAIFKYLINGRNNNTDSDYLFLSSRAPFRPLKTKVCTDALRRAGTSATDFHRLRRTCATDILRTGATFIETAEFIGHSDTHSVHKYVALDNERMILCPLSLNETNLMIERRYAL